MILVDSNVAIDSFNVAATYHAWSLRMLAEAREAQAFVNGIVVAELAVRAESRQQLDEVMQILGLPLDPLDTDVAFRAGQAFADWIDNGGRRGALLPDLLIGAHASVRKARILTRDPRRFRRYFPEVELILPDHDDD